MLEDGEMLALLHLCLVHLFLLRVGMFLISVTRGQRAQGPCSHVDRLAGVKALILCEAVPLFLQLCI